LVGPGLTVLTGVVRVLFVAKRLMTPLYQAGDMSADAFVYTNRLSDYFFVASRFVNHMYAVDEVIWKK